MNAKLSPVQHEALSLAAERDNWTVRASLRTLRALERKGLVCYVVAQRESAYLTEAGYLAVQR